MSPITQSARAAARIMGLAAAALIVLDGATSLPAAAATAHVPAIRWSASTDLSAARRHHRAPRASVRQAYGSMAAGASAPQSPRFGYGVGDNSRNQTW